MKLMDTCKEACRYINSFLPENTLKITAVTVVALVAIKALRIAFTNYSYKSVIFAGIVLGVAGSCAVHHLWMNRKTPPPKKGEEEIPKEDLKNEADFSSVLQDFKYEGLSVGKKDQSLFPKDVTLIPNDILNHIFSYLKNRKVRKLSEVSKEFYLLVWNPQLPKHSWLYHSSVIRELETKKNNPLIAYPQKNGLGVMIQGKEIDLIRTYLRPSFLTDLQTGEKKLKRTVNDYRIEADRGNQEAVEQLFHELISQDKGIPSGTGMIVSTKDKERTLEFIEDYAKRGCVPAFDALEYFYQKKDHTLKTNEILMRLISKPDLAGEKALSILLNSKTKDDTERLNLLKDLADKGYKAARTWLLNKVYKNSYDSKVAAAGLKLAKDWAKEGCEASIHIFLSAYIDGGFGLDPLLSETKSEGLRLLRKFALGDYAKFDHLKFPIALANRPRKQPWNHSEAALELFMRVTDRYESNNGKLGLDITDPKLRYEVLAIAKHFERRSDVCRKRLVRDRDNFIPSGWCRVFGKPVYSDPQLDKVQKKTISPFKWEELTKDEIEILHKIDPLEFKDIESVKLIHDGVTSLNTKIVGDGKIRFIVWLGSNNDFEKYERSYKKAVKASVKIFKYDDISKISIFLKKLDFSKIQFEGRILLNSSAPESVVSKIIESYKDKFEFKVYTEKDNIKSFLKFKSA